MIAYKVNIIWTKYSPEYPDVVSFSLFNDYKTPKGKILPTIPFVFWKIFKYQLSIILVAIFVVFADENHLFASVGVKGELITIFGTLILIAALVNIGGFILSAISYISSYFYSKQYITSLNKCIFENNNYNEFCESMSSLDARYIMQMQRLHK